MVSDLDEPQASLKHGFSRLNFAREGTNTALDLFLREWQTWRTSEAHSSQGNLMVEENGYGPGVRMLC
jgi:hypothetical protein